jgi:putative PEP-CTERM system histidine kinase
LCLGVAVVFAFDIFLLSEALMYGQLDADTFRARGAVHLLAAGVLFFGARRRSDWISRLQVSHSVAFHSATLVLAGIYLLLLSGAGYYIRYFGGDWGGALQLSLVFAAVAALAAFTLSSALRARLRVFLGKHFFSYRFDYREQWLRFTAKLAVGGSPSEVSLHVIQGLADMVECPGGSLWTRAEPDAPYTQGAHWNVPPVAESEPADGALATFLRDKAWIVNLDEYRSAPRNYAGLAMPHWLLAMPNAWLAIPLLVDRELLGFVVLARPRAPIDVNWEVLDLIKTASRQAAGYLAQMQATEALLEARKFDAFNRMSAFVVHDLKNIVTQLSLMLKNAERLHDNREFQQDMLLTVESSLEKMKRLMLQLREGAAPPGGSRGVELQPIVRRLQSLAERQGRVLEVERLERLVTRGHDERLERVLGHLVQNALDATPANGRVWLRAERASGQIRIEIGDTGVGMSDEFMQTRLFKPFSSTKGMGMGVGSYESAQYVRELGGSIKATSREGQGTTMTVLLPLLEVSQGSDLRAADSA